MAQTWVPKEHSIRAEIDPGGRATIDVVIRPGQRPFRLMSIDADNREDRDAFRVVECHAGRWRTVGRSRTLPVTGVFGMADVGVAISVTVENVSNARKAFSGHLVGEELEER